MFLEVSKAGIEVQTQLTPSSSSVFEDAYDSVSSSFRSLKETVVENPYTSTAIGLAATAGLLYLTRGKLWGAAAKSETAFLRLSSHSQETHIALGNELSHSPVNPELLARIKAAAQGEFRSSIPNTSTLFPAGEPTRQLRHHFPDFAKPPIPDSSLYARVRAAAKGDITVRKFSIDPPGKAPLSNLKNGMEIKKDTLTGPGAKGARISDGTLRGASGGAALNAKVADALVAWMRK